MSGDATLLTITAQSPLVGTPDLVTTLNITTIYYPFYPVAIAPLSGEFVVAPGEPLTFNIQFMPLTPTVKEFGACNMKATEYTKLRMILRCPHGEVYFPVNESTTSFTLTSEMTAQAGNCDLPGFSLTAMMDGGLVWSPIKVVIPDQLDNVTMTPIEFENANNDCSGTNASFCKLENQTNLNGDALDEYTADCGYIVPYDRLMHFKLNAAQGDENDHFVL